MSASTRWARKVCATKTPAIAVMRLALGEKWWPLLARDCDFHDRILSQSMLTAAASLFRHGG